MKEGTMEQPMNYGKSYWCVKTPLSKDGEIYLYADRVELREGTLIFWGRFYPPRGESEPPDYDNPEGEERILFIFNKDKWKACYGADKDEYPLAAEHWEGEIVTAE